MNIFIIGLPQSGKTTVAKAISEKNSYNHIDCLLEAKSSFRPPLDGELPEKYHEEYNNFILHKIKSDQNRMSYTIQNMINFFPDQKFIIDEVSSPKEFILLFNPSKDLVLFLNRIDYDAECKDFQNIGVSVIRDYCFWLASTGTLAKNRWIEYNFRIPGEDSEAVKTLGSKNTVYLVKSINKVIGHFQELLLNLQGPQS